jgi:diguanylate cyclase (GGDEF)-like protein/PAS domain S-box-containing protein
VDDNRAISPGDEPFEPATADVLRRVAEAAAIHIYELRYAADGSYKCTAFIGEGLESLIGPVPAGVDEEEAWEDAVHPGDRDRYAQFGEACRRGEASEVEYRLVGHDGVTRWVWERGRPRIVDGVVYVDGIVADITERRNEAAELAAARERLEHAAMHDSLTGLANRPAFEARLAGVLETAGQGSVAVLLVDLDDFKLVNDGFGLERGDALLRETAARIGRACRDAEMVARPGGDEFLILVGPVAGGAARMRADSVALAIRDALTQPFEMAGSSVYVTPSIGVSVFPDDGDTPAELLKYADIALYSAKEGGRDSHRFYRRPNRDSTAELTVAAELRDALRRDELTLYYQPLVDLAQSCVVGAEALIRWQHPTRGLLAPGAFLTSAERTGLIRPITSWVIERACIQARRWCDRDLDLYVSVNLPPTYWQPNAIRRMLATIGSFGIAADRLMIEVTEQAAMAEAAELDQMVGVIHTSGLRVAIDDFGTGYSSLGRLRHLRPSLIKIDRSFVADAATDRDAAVLVETMITMAQKLGVSCLAEGIETEAQLEFLRRLGCPLGQGFLYSRPLPAAQFDALLLGDGRAAA